MEQETARVNKLPPVMRSRRLEIQNVTDAIYPLLLKISGSPTFSFTLEITRGN